MTSDLLAETAGELSWNVTDLAGTSLARGSKRVAIPARASGQAHELDLSELLAKHGAANVLIWVALASGESVSRNLLTYARPREMALNDPKLSFSVEGAGTEWSVTLTAAQPALWVWLELAGREARFSDNFCHIQPGEPLQIRVAIDQEMTREEFMKALSVRSLFDTYREAVGPVAE